MAGAFKRYEPVVRSVRPGPVASAVDLPMRAATCNASALVSAKLRKHIMDEGRIMQTASPGSSFPGMYPRDVTEYDQLIAKGCESARRI